MPDGRSTAAFGRPLNSIVRSKEIMQDRTDEIRDQQRRSNWLLGAYALCLIGLVSFAPKNYEAVVPAAHAFSAISRHPAAVGFAMDMMWALFPIFLVALAWRPKPIQFNGSSQALGRMLLLGLVITPLALYFGTMNTSFDLGDSSKLGRAVIRSAQSKAWFAVHWGMYYVITLAMAWLGYVEAPRWLIFSDRKILGERSAFHFQTSFRATRPP